MDEEKTADTCHNIKIAKRPKGHVPAVRWHSCVKKDGKEFYIAQITTPEGTHEVYLEMEKVHNGEIEVRNPPKKKKINR